jgi:hypothetical protein
MFATIFFVAAASVAVAQAASYSFTIDTTYAPTDTSDEFLGFNIDTSSLGGRDDGSRVNFMNSDLRALTSVIAKASQGEGALMRLGGSSADSSAYVFNPDDGAGQTILIEKEYLDEILDFVKVRFSSTPSSHFAIHFI